MSKRSIASAIAVTALAAGTLSACGGSGTSSSSVAPVTGAASGAAGGGAVATAPASTTASPAPGGTTSGAANFSTITRQGITDAFHCAKVVKSDLPAEALQGATDSFDCDLFYGDGGTNTISFADYPDAAGAQQGSKQTDGAPGLVFGTWMVQTTDPEVLNYLPGAMVRAAGGTVPDTTAYKDITIAEVWSALRCQGSPADIATPDKYHGDYGAAGLAIKHQYDCRRSSDDMVVDELNSPEDAQEFISRQPRPEDVAAAGRWMVETNNDEQAASVSSLITALGTH